MIALVFSMVRARSGQALIAFLLATFAVAAAVSAPVYLAAADQAMVTSEVAGATPAERAVQIKRLTLNGDRTFERFAPTAFAIPGFSSVFSTGFEAFVDVQHPIVPHLVYRDDVCAHVRLVAGRCFATITEVILAPDAAKIAGVQVGDAIPVATAVNAPPDGWIPNPDPEAPRAMLTVVGLYEPRDEGESYWGGAAYFGPFPGDPMVVSAVFATRPTLELFRPNKEQQQLDVVVGDGAITAASLPRVRASVKQAIAGASGLGAGTSVTTRLPKLLDRTERNRQLVTSIVPVAAVPLVGLCWLVLFVAVSAGTQERRFELGLLALRGVRVPHRWWLAAGEAVLPILLGAVAGYFVGYLAVRAAVVLLLSHSGGVPIGTGATRWALIAVAGALLAGLLAQRRELAQPTVDLLRNVPNRLGRWRSVVAETVVVLVAVAAVVQLRTGDAGLQGIAVLAPALVVLAIGVLAARAVGPIADRAGARALERGRIGPMLAAYAMSRRPGGQRVLALLVVAIALLCFAATAANVGGRARDERVNTELGAARVVAVDDLTRAALLTKTRAADPDGTWAMAVAALPGERAEPGAPNTLAVDAPRLAAVAEWRGGTSAAAVAAKLHPAGIREPLTLSNKDFDIDLTLDSLREGYRVTLFAVVSPLDGSGTDRINFGEVKLGRHTYTRSAPMCVAGCRLAGIELRQPEGRGFAVDLTLHEIRQAGKVVVGPAGFGEPGAWRGPASPGAKLLVPEVRPATGGLRVELSEYTGGDVAVEALPGDWPSPLPVAVARGTALDSNMRGADETYLAVDVAAELASVPRFGNTGALVDLEYADRAATGTAIATDPEVWLGRHAPPDALDRLRAQGLIVIGDRSASRLRAALDGQGPAVALRFHELAAGFAVVLAGGALWLVAGVDRRRRTPEMRALRAQGVSRRDANTSGFLAMAGTAALIGPFAALVSWLLVGDRVPIFVDQVTTIDIPRWPQLPAFLAAWFVAALVLAAVALLTRIPRRSS